MNLLVTGAAGFLGSYVVREALARGHRVTPLMRSYHADFPAGEAIGPPLIVDLAKADSLNLAGLKIDAVVHLAASLTGSRESQHATTIQGTRNLLDAMQQVQIRRLVGISSIAVLDYAAAEPMSLIDESVPVAGNDQAMGAYATLKAEQERLFADFAAHPGRGCAILRPGIVYDVRRMVNAHAGLLKGGMQLLASHSGEVPVVLAESVARAIVSAAEREFSGAALFHLVDDKLPGQKAYLSGLRRRGLIARGGITLPWRILAASAALAYRIASAAGLRDRLPEALLPHGFAARIKPFRYSNLRAKHLLGWVPYESFY